MKKLLYLIVLIVLVSCEKNREVFYMNKDEALAIIHRFYPDEAFNDFHIGDISDISLGHDSAPDDWGELSVEGFANYHFLPFSMGHTIPGDIGQAKGRPINNDAILLFHGSLNVPVFIQIAYMKSNEQVILLYRNEFKPGKIEEKVNLYDLVKNLIDR